MSTSTLGHLAGNFPKHLNPFLNRKQRIFFEVAQDAYDQMIEDLRAPLDQVEVSVRNRVKGPRIYGQDIFSSLRCLEQTL